MIKFNITKAIGLIAFTVGVVLFFKATNEKDIAIRCTHGILGGGKPNMGSISIILYKK